MLEHAAVARHQARRGEAEHLPEREVPRHHREHDAERIEVDEGLLRALDRHRLAREVARGVLGEVLARAGALVDLGEAVGHGLAHLLGHQGGELGAARTQHAAALRMQAARSAKLARRQSRCARPARPGQPRRVVGAVPGVGLPRRGSRDRRG
jgi:hypothetical protein